MRNILPIACLVALAAVSTARAQLSAPGPSGVVMGHLHLTASDTMTSRGFWNRLGGAAAQNGTLQLIEFPGTFVMLRNGQPTAGSAGSTVDHVTFLVGDRQESVALLAKELGLAVSADGTITAQDGLRVRLVGDPTLDKAIRFASISIMTTAPAETQAWYIKQFGAVPGQGAPLIARLPGVTLEFGKADAAPAGTKGRALDHIGFDVKNLEEFCKKLEANGIKLDRAYTKLPNSTTAIAFLTDPWGTYIELTENLAPAK